MFYKQRRLKKRKYYLKGFHDCEKLSQKKLIELKQTHDVFVTHLIEEMTFKHNQQIIEVADLYTEVVQTILQTHNQQLMIFEDETKLKNKLLSRKLNRLEKTITDWRKSKDGLNKYTNEAKNIVRSKVKTTRAALRDMACLLKGWEDLDTIETRADGFIRKKEKNNVKAISSTRQW